MNRDKFKEEEKRIATELMKKSKEQIIELYLQVKFERDYLQAQYEKAVFSKFKIGQTSYYIFDDIVGIFKPEKVCEVRDVLILGIQIYEQGIQYQTTYGLFNEDNLFATKEEAEAKLKELKDE